MPVTPFHFGPGGLIAIAARRSVSFLAFCASNVLIDVESLVNRIAHEARVHTFFHTYVGSTSVMHGDIRPLAPLSVANTLYRIVSVSTLHWSCLFAGALAGLLWMLQPVANSRG